MAIRKVINGEAINLDNGGGGGSSPSASDVSYDNTDSGLDATNVQDAVDEVKDDLGSKSSASAVTGNDAFSKIATLNSELTYAVKIENTITNGFDFTTGFIGKRGKVYAINNEDKTKYYGAPTGWSGKGFMIDLCISDYLIIRFLYDIDTNKLHQNVAWYGGFVGWHSTQFS
jgi:hypothetical protein